MQPDSVIMAYATQETMNAKWLIAATTPASATIVIRVARRSAATISITLIATAVIAALMIPLTVITTLILSTITSLLLLLVPTAVLIVCSLWLLILSSSVVRALPVVISASGTYGCKDGRCVNRCNRCTMTSNEWIYLIVTILLALDYFRGVDCRRMAGFENFSAGWNCAVVAVADWSRLSPDYHRRLSCAAAARMASQAGVGHAPVPVHPDRAPGQSHASVYPFAYSGAHLRCSSYRWSQCLRAMPTPQRYPLSCHRASESLAPFVCSYIFRPFHPPYFWYSLTNGMIAR